MIKNINYKLVDTAGQITAVVFGAYSKKYMTALSNQIMYSDKAIEQVAFVYQDSNVYKLKMMGGELSINGSLAGALLIKSKRVSICSLNETVTFLKQDRYISGRFPTKIVQSIQDNFIKLLGICYIISNDKNIINKYYLKRICKKYNIPAMGVINYKENRIMPCIYVLETDSLINENACGSGSLSFFLYSGINKIVQPSGKIIEIAKDKNYFTIKVDAKILE